MLTPTRIYISVPRDGWLQPEQLDIKRGIIDKIKAIGFEPHEFLISGDLSHLTWSYENLQHILGVDVTVVTQYASCDNGQQLIGVNLIGFVFGHRCIVGPANDDGSSSLNTRAVPIGSSIAERERFRFASCQCFKLTCRIK